MTPLAIKGGSPLRRTPFPTYVTIGEEEKKAVMAVLDSKVLSDFLGTWSPQFFGGARVQQLEKEWCAYFRVKHSVSVNSATSGLYAAVGAAGVGPGDEVIVSPYTMSASAAAALVYGGIPVFADISPETFCLDPESVRRCVTPRTRAIIVVDIFGHPAAMDEIMTIAREHDLVVIEDAAQAPGAMYRGRYAGTLGHIGVFSLNYHKTIHCGEGGVIVTDDDSLAERLQLIRNHGETVVEAKGTVDLVNMIGFNYRMTEIEATIASEQLKKLESLLVPRIAAAAYLTRRLGKLPGLTPPVTQPQTRHGFYVYALRYDAAKTGVSRDKLVAALKAEGLPIFPGYVRPIYLQPAYQKRIALGRDGFPFNLADAKNPPSYQRGICPVTERMHEQELLYTNICHADIKEQDLEDFCAGFEKVFAQLHDLA